MSNSISRPPMVGSRPSWRPSGPIAPSVGVYRTRRKPSYLAIYVFFSVLVLFAVAFTVYLIATSGDRPWPGR